jgi:hypothetical protein
MLGPPGRCRVIAAVAPVRSQPAGSRSPSSSSATWTSTSRGRDSSGFRSSPAGPGEQTVVERIAEASLTLYQELLDFG